MKQIADSSRMIMIYGAGGRGTLCAEILISEGINPAGFLDRDSRKTGKMIMGLRVFKPTILHDIPTNITIVLAVAGHDSEIKEYIEHMRIEQDIQYLTYAELIENESEQLAAGFLHRLPAKQNGFYNKYKVFYDHQIFSLQKRGGISRYNYEIISHMLLDDRFGIDLFEGVNNNAVDFISKQNEFSRYYGEKAERIDSSLILFEANKKLQKRFTEDQKYDICHATYYDLPAYVNYRKLIITVHDLIQERYGIDPKTAEKKKRIIGAADGIIAVSENTKRDLMQCYGVDEGKIRVVYEANSLTQQASVTRPVAREYILYVGNRSYYKNYGILAQAFAGLPSEYQLVFFGGGEFSTEEINCFEELGILDRVNHVSGDDQLLADYYHHAVAFVYPSEYEGFGLPILEAMHYGTPVIAADNSSLPEVGGDACLYFDAKSSDELRDQLVRIISDDDLRQQISEAGLRREKLFSWDRSAKETAEFYLEIMKKE